MNNKDLRIVNCRWQTQREEQLSYLVDVHPWKISNIEDMLLSVFAVIKSWIWRNYFSVRFLSIKKYLHFICYKHAILSTCTQGKVLRIISKDSVIASNIQVFWILDVLSCLSCLNLHYVCCQGQFYRLEDIPVVGWYSSQSFVTWDVCPQVSHIWVVTRCRRTDSMEDH